MGTSSRVVESGPLLEYLLAQHGEQVLVAAVSVLEADKSKQIDNTEDADSAKLKNVATAARVLQVSRNTQTGAWVVTLEGWCRVYLEDAPREGRQKFLLVTVEQAGPSKDMRLKDNDLDKEGQELADALHAGTGRLAGSPATGRLAELLQKLSPPAAADVLASMLTRDTAFKQLVLEAVDHNERMRLVVGLIQRTLDSVQGRAKQSGDDSQQQLTIPPRLQLLPPSPFKGVFKGGANGPEEEEEEELSALMQRIKAAKPPAEVLKVASREYRRLKKSNEHHPGHAMSRAYLETLADLPWNTFSGETQAPSNPEAPQARDLLDKDHYGLDKDRIVQYLAVRRLRGADARAPILCFVGPPGTGKTSLASSISKVLLRPFQRVSVGGVRDEAEIRGHRRTYIGAMPGRIIQAVRRSSVRDPVLLLDEVDKMGHDSLRGDPASALLEVLDPNQNQAFVDTYLSVPFDLSQVVFVATANQLQNMSAPLLDRLEIIQLSGYTLDEKCHIAQRHLIPGLLGEHGLTSDQLHFPAEAILLIADGYTREAGVRSLSRSLAAICRHVTVKIWQSQTGQQTQHDGRRPADHEVTHPAPEYATSGGHQHQTHSSKRIPHTRAGSSRTAGSSDGKGPLSNPYGGVNADMSRSGHAEVACLTVTAELIEEVLGPRKYNETDSADSLVSPGSAAGLVWTAVGGQVQYVECCCTSTGQPQRPGKLVLTGQVGEVLQESAHLALSWIRSHTHQLAAAAAATGQSRPTSTAVPDRARLRAAGDGDDATAEACSPQDVAQESGLQHPTNLISGSGDVAAGHAQPTLLSDRHQACWHTPAQASEETQANCLSADNTCAGQGQGYRSWHTSHSAPMSSSALSHNAEEAEADTSSLHAVSANGNEVLGAVRTAAAQWDVHVHLPAGAVSKDGPSAGITLATAMVSLFLGRCARADTAMTGELTLRGLVLPIGMPQSSTATVETMCGDAQ
ncbi:MAG: lon protease protein peroxisomal-like [Trebouxia sp. A1-2]|nr:MAG: lon protease protein peroxisomal-like [Trebouxia sp. A1-2]